MKKIKILFVMLLTSMTLQAQTGLHFDGVDDHVAIDTLGDHIYDFTGDFTLEAWVKIEGGVWPTIISKFDNVGGSRFGYWFGSTGSGVLGFQVFDGTSGGWPTVYSSSNITDNTWHHIAGVMDSDTLKVYVDGVQEGSLLSPFTPVYNEHAMWLGNDAESDIFQGTMDGVRIWNFAKSAVEINEQKDICLTGTEPGLLSLYQFDEGAGSIINDGVSSGTISNGELTNMDPLTDWVPGWSCASPGDVGVSALSFDGSNDVVIAPDAPQLDVLGEDTLTIEFWFKTANNQFQNVFNKWGEDLIGYGVSISSTGEMAMAKANTATSYAQINSQNGFNDGEWHHFVGIMRGEDATDYEMYVDGVIQPVVIQSNNLSGTIVNTDPLVFGRFNTVTPLPYEGKLDEVRIWKRELSIAEITDFENSELCPADSSLIAYYQFNEGTGNVDNPGVTNAPDHSMYINDATLVDFALSGVTSNWVDGYVFGSFAVVGIDTTIDQSGVTLTSNQEGATYQWLDCDNGFDPINGEEGQSFVATENGNYAVEITVNNCTKVSDCYEVSTIGVNEEELNAIKIYPNPSNGEINVNIGDLASATIEIHDTRGKLVKQLQVGDQITKLALNEGAGFYFVTVKTDRFNKHLPIVIK